MKSSVFPNMIVEPGIGISTSSVGLALNAFWKIALHMYIAIFQNVTSANPKIEFAMLIQYHCNLWLFPKSHKRHSKNKCGSNDNAKFMDCV